jgi:cytochrome c2
MKIAIYISGILLFISFIIILQDDFNQEWKQTQIRFQNIVENRFHSNEGNNFTFEPGIKQVSVNGLKKIDRCQTCHLGINDSKYTKTENPFKFHPGNLLITHKSKEFGCTSCHQGQGYAVTYKKAAHNKLEFWNETMLLKELIQASCGTCHLSEEVPEANILTRGRLLIKDKGCTGCHEINEFFEEESRGPDLSGIGNKVTLGWLYHWLKNPRDYLKKSRMPSYKLQDDQIISLIEYLMSLNEKTSPPHIIEQSPIEEGDVDKGKILVGESRCISCHSISDRGGKLSPELERVGDKVREDWLANFMRNIHYYQPEKKMLEYNFSDQNALNIAAFIFEEYSEEEYELPEDVQIVFNDMTVSRKNQRIDKGQELFGKLGCSGCHNINGKNSYSKIGAKLTNIGNRLESSLDFGNHNDILPTLYNWLFMKLKTPDIFDSSSIMPNFYLSDMEAFEITTALLGNKENDYSREYLVFEKKESLYKKPAGQFGELFERYSCISCHSVDKYGGDLSTAPLTIEGSKVKFDWLKDYLIKPYAIRPILTERMPRFRMSEKDASLMADYIKTVYVSDEIPRYFEYELSKDDEMLGKDLFNNMDCNSCHIINGEGGYVGPSLDNVGNRLEAGWIYQWLLTPLKYKPETIHPDFGFSDQEAKQITAYLVSKRRVN